MWLLPLVSKKTLRKQKRHCEESDETIHTDYILDCFAASAITLN